MGEEFEIIAPNGALYRLKLNKNVVDDIAIDPEKQDRLLLLCYLQNICPVEGSQYVNPKWDSVREVDEPSPPRDSISACHNNNSNARHPSTCEKEIMQMGLGGVENVPRMQSPKKSQPTQKPTCLSRGEKLVGMCKTVGPLKLPSHQQEAAPNEVKTVVTQYPPGESPTEASILVEQKENVPPPPVLTTQSTFHQPKADKKQVKTVVVLQRLPGQECTATSALGAQNLNVQPAPAVTQKSFVRQQSAASNAVKGVVTQRPPGESPTATLLEIKKQVTHVIGILLIPKVDHPLH